MKLQEILDQLSSGEFSQISIGGAEAGVIDATNYAKVVGHINLGLTALYTRFNLKKGQVVVELQPEQRLYKLHSSFADNVRYSRETLRYVKDTAADPFCDDILKIEKILTDEDDEFPLNDAEAIYSIDTPRSTHIMVPAVLVEAAEAADKPDWMDTTNLTIHYRANHPKIVVGQGYFNPERIEVELPASHLEALLFYVASRVQAPIGMSQEGAVAVQYSTRFEQACQILEGNGMQIDKVPTNTRLSRGGWA